MPYISKKNKMESGQYSIPEKAFQAQRQGSILIVTCNVLLPVTANRIKKRVVLKSEADLNRDTVLTECQLEEAEFKVGCIKIKRQLFSTIEKGLVEINGNVHQINKERIGGVVFDHGPDSKHITNHKGSGRPKKSLTNESCRGI